MNKENKPLKIAIKTFGCQMNVYDTQVAEGLLGQAGFEIVKEQEGEDRGGPESGGVNPNMDVILMNTCSVREHAEDRVYGRLGMLGKIKRYKPELIVGLMGCMVEEHREKLFKKFPQIDLMVGTRNIKELPSLIEDIRRNRRQVAKIKQDGISIEYTDQIKRGEGEFHAWLPIMTGCNKVCTFCIVPITRGSEVSMPAREVYREASRLVSEGIKCITLLGQNVNSYRGEVTSDQSLAFSDSFPGLLEMLCQIEDLQRISFTTSHPHDATEELFQVIARNPKISRRFHLPLQSGSNRILKRMKRLHTFDEYREKIRLMREIIPGVSVTTDIIAGFSGETEDDYQATAAALREIRFDGAYIYKYSLRPATPASNLPDDVPIKVKEARNAELLALQRKITEEEDRKLIGQTFEVLSERTSPKNRSEVLGRTFAEKKVVFRAPASLLGTVQKVQLTDLRRDTFIGSMQS